MRKILKIWTFLQVITKLPAIASYYLTIIFSELRVYISQFIIYISQNSEFLFQNSEFSLNCEI